jgi:hypothetical protein
MIVLGKLLVHNRQLFKPVNRETVVVGPLYCALANLGYYYGEAQGKATPKLMPEERKNNSFP